MSLLNRIAAQITNSPEVTRDTHAYEVYYRTPEGDGITAVVTHGGEDIGGQIRRGAIDKVQNLTDYTFAEFDLRATQLRVAARQLLGVATRLQGEIEEYDDYLG